MLSAFSVSSCDKSVEAALAHLGNEGVGLERGEVLPRAQAPYTLRTRSVGAVAVLSLHSLPCIG